jgi:hypothetical protein
LTLEEENEFREIGTNPGFHVNGFTRLRNWYWRPICHYLNLPARERRGKNPSGVDLWPASIKAPDNFITGKLLKESSSRKVWAKGTSAPKKPTKRREMDIDEAFEAPDEIPLESDSAVDDLLRPDDILDDLNLDMDVDYDLFIAASEMSPVFNASTPSLQHYFHGDEFPFPGHTFDV